MASTLDLRLPVLHGLKLKGFAEAEAIAAVSGAKSASVVKELAVLAKEGLVLHREGRISGYALTPAGRAEHHALLASDVSASGKREVLEGVYHRFLVLNAELLVVCTAWQMKDVARNVVNDHTDRLYDAEVVERLSALHNGVSPLCAELQDALARFGNYKKRLDAALAKVKKGERDWFAKPIMDSYHTVWMELHEDLLASLQIDRASEGS